MKRKMLMGLVGVLGLLGMAAPAMAHEHDRGWYEDGPMIERGFHERRERDLRRWHRFNHERFGDERFEHGWLRDRGRFGRRF